MSDGTGGQPVLPRPSPQRPPWWFYAVIGGAAAVAAGIFVLRSGREGDQVVPTPAATTSPLPPATSTPTTPPPTSAPPSPSPSPTTPETAALGASCSSDREGYGIDYPADWHASSGRDWSCQLFDPQSFAVEPNTEPPIVAITVYVDQYRMGRLRDALTDPAFYEVISEEGGRFSDANRPGAILETRQTEDLLWPAGTLTYSVLVNRIDTTIVVTTNDLAGGYEQNKQIALAMAESLRIGG